MVKKRRKKKKKEERKRRKKKEKEEKEDIFRQRYCFIVVGIYIFDNKDN